MRNRQNKPDTSALLSVRDLSISFAPGGNVLERVSFDVRPGKTVALVGESGSGKTLSCRSIIQLLPKNAQITSGTIEYRKGDSLIEPLKLRGQALRDLRGSEISMIFQEPMRSLSPLHTIGDQVGEVLSLHSRMSRSEIHENVIAAFARVGFPDPERAFKSYPFELSGGMRQRAMIAMAIIGQPQVLIADEPTTALDVTTQATVLGLLRTLQRETGMAMILVTHDLGVVANMADDVVVMERGRVVEAAPLRLVLGDPRHSYTRRLIAAAPMIPEDPAPRKEAVAPDVLLEMRNISKTFTMRAARPWSTPVLVRAVQDFNLDVPRNTTVAIVGESGSGKTTCARIALGAMPADDGAFIRYNSKKCAPIDVHDLTPSTRKPFQLLAQMVFQDPYSTLNPRMRVRETLFEPMEIHRKGTRAEREARAEELLVQVGLSPVMLGRYPHAFSGGQRQRLSIARALMMGPEFLVCDEPTSALDVSVQEQVLALLEELQEQMGLSYLFISHDLAVVARIADEVAVMRRGLVVEQGPPDLLFCNPTHPYTRALIAAQPEPDVNRPIDLDAVSRGAGDPSQWPEAFRFEAGDVPPLRSVEDNHMVRQHG